jgi:hypothetical protein
MGSGVAGAGESEPEPAKQPTRHARHGSGGPRTLQSIGKWAQSEAAAKLKAANAAIGARRPATQSSSSAGADGHDGATGPS